MDYGKQSISEADIRAVEEVLKSDYLTCGPKVKEFEAAICEYTGAEHAVAVSNGTAALHLLALALRPKSVVVPDITFMATANAFAHVGANVELIDIDEDQPMIQYYNSLCKYVDVVVPVHMAGFTTDLDNIDVICKGHVIEDACHALGTKWRSLNGDWHKTGDCARSLATVFSFHPVKPITTGEGGMITTNDEALATELRQLRSHGIENGNYDMSSIG